MDNPMQTLPTNSLENVEIVKLDFEEVPQFSQRDVAYVKEDERLKEFYKYPVDIQSFEKVIEDKKKDHTDRKLLVTTLKEQYQKLRVHGNTWTNIDALENPHTFTIITAHQPSLFTGPLYFIYKIISTINLCKTLQVEYPSYTFVPVFLLGGEDHDFEEIKSTQLFNQTLTWENEEEGAVGNRKTASLAPTLQQLKRLLGETKNAQHIYQIIASAYTKNDQYAAATIQLVLDLFGKEGLVVVSMNEKNFKKAFIPVIKDEIFNAASLPLVEKARQNLVTKGFTGQATPRAINFFYLIDQVRERIVKEGDTFFVLNTDLSFSQQEIETEIEKYPERFSPNVIMRPIFQEYIFPNLAYIGGGGELAYWLERREQFEHFKVNFPMLIRRNSALWIDAKMSRKMEKLNLSVQDLFEETETLIQQHVKEHASEELSLSTEIQKLEDFFKKLSLKAKKIDPTLEAAVLAEAARQVKRVSHIETKMMRAEKNKQSQAIVQIKAIKNKLFYKNGLQERRDNFLNFYTEYGSSFFDILKDNLHPLEKKFVVVKVNDSTL